MAVQRRALYQVDAFTTEKFAGNPAGVVLDADGLSEADMQHIARELGNPETAFVFEPSSTDHDVWLRFFTPVTEVPSCGHATIAAHYVRAVEGRAEPGAFVQKIGAGNLPVRIIHRDNDYTIEMTQGDIDLREPFAGDDRNAILDALALNASDVDDRCPVQIVSTGHSKVIVGIRDRAVLDSLRPDLTALSAISARIRCNGYFVFTFDTGSTGILTRGRMFAPAIGIPEDPVTGNANGPLGAYLVANGMGTGGEYFRFNGSQGHAMDRPGIVSVEVDIEEGRPKRVKISGRAVIVFSTHIEL